jgi:hypothetical protein
MKDAKITTLAVQEQTDIDGLLANIPDVNLDELLPFEDVNLDELLLFEDVNLDELLTFEDFNLGEMLNDQKRCYLKKIDLQELSDILEASTITSSSNHAGLLIHSIEHPTIGKATTIQAGDGGLLIQP